MSGNFTLGAHVSREAISGLLGAQMDRVFALRDMYFAQTAAMFRATAMGWPFSRWPHPRITAWQRYVRLRKTLMEMSGPKGT